MIDEKDLPDDLKDDLIPEIDPKKLFDENEYATIIVGAEGVSKKDIHNTEYISALTDKLSTRDEKDEALLRLKENNAQLFLLKAIKKTSNNNYKAILVAACWETGLDFSNNFSEFVDLLGDKDFTVSFEAFTVIREMENLVDQSKIRSALEKLIKIEEPTVSVLDTIELLNQKIQDLNGE